MRLFTRCIVFAVILSIFPGSGIISNDSLNTGKKGIEGKNSHCLRLGYSILSSKWEGWGSRFDLNMGVDRYEIGINYMAISGDDDGIAQRKVTITAWVSGIPSLSNKSFGCSNPLEYEQITLNIVKKYRWGEWFRFKISGGCGYGWGIERKVINEKVRIISRKGVPPLFYREETEYTYDIQENEITSMAFPFEISLEFLMYSRFRIELGYGINFTGMGNDGNLRIAASIILF